jgi:serine/threonine-protein kinase
MSLPIAQLAASVSDYEFDGTKPLGAGAFGTVYKATHKTTKEVVAIKFLKDSILPDQQKAFMRELSILASNEHPSTLRLIGFTFTPVPGRVEQGPIIITPIMPHGTLNDMLKLERQKTTPVEWTATTKSKCIFGTARAMAYIHSLNVMHRDLKPENVFLDANFEPVLADFGISKNCTNDLQRTMGTVGSPLFMAPEIYNDEDLTAGGPAYDLSVDVYSFGVMLYVMFSPDGCPKLEGGKIPRSSTMLMSQVGKGTRFEKLPHIPDYYWDLITRCWSHAPSKRPTFDDIVADFRANHHYLWPGADKAEVTRYEERVTDPLDDQLMEALTGTGSLSGSKSGFSASMTASTLTTSARGPRRIK